MKSYTAALLSVYDVVLKGFSFQDFSLKFGTFALAFLAGF